jgi:hypothetical protein
MRRRYNRHAAVDIMDDVGEESWVSRGSQAQPHEDEEDAKKIEENLIYIAIITASMGRYARDCRLRRNKKEKPTTLR